MCGRSAEAVPVLWRRGLGRRDPAGYIIAVVAVDLRCAVGTTLLRFLPGSAARHTFATPRMVAVVSIALT
jgi:hypothetical protein